jgi:2-oxoglutarate ferredoxin oxidoreductase subunit beta
MCGDHALVSNGSFVARGFAGDIPHLTKLIIRAIKHKGFALIDIFQPCVSFNYVNTYDWFRKRIYKLEDNKHNISDGKKALEKAFEWGDKIPIGIFYEKESHTYQDNLPYLNNKNLTKISKENVDITSTLNKMK